jgi:hypothetical protein
MLPVKLVMALASRSWNDALAASSRRRRSRAWMLRWSALFRLPGSGGETVGPRWLASEVAMARAPVVAAEP